MKCRNLLPERKTREAFVQELLGLPMDERVRRGVAVGLSREDIQAGNIQDCARLGDIDMSKVDPDLPSFAISFVTGMSGFLAAAVMLRHADGSPFSLDGRHHSLYFNMLNPIIGLRNDRPRRGCDRQGSGGDFYQRLWLPPAA
jgi:hypothetical protein